MINTIKAMKMDWHIYAIPISTISGLLYFTIAMTGAGNLQTIFQFNNDTPMYFISICAAICYAMFTFKSFEFLTWRPKTFSSWFLAILAPFAASPFFLAGIEGTSKLNIFSISTGIAIGSMLFFIRMITFIDGAVKFPDRITEIKSAFRNAIVNKDHRSLLCILIVVYTSIGYSLSTTDSIYTASVNIFSWLGLMPGYSLSFIGYVSSALGAVVGLPMIFYWTQRGMTQLTNSGVPDKNGFLRDPTDHYTYVGLIASLPIILGCIGAATSSSAQVFGKLGVFSEVVRLSSSVIFAICGGVPGLSTLFRGFKHLRLSKQTC